MKLTLNEIAEVLGSTLVGTDDQTVANIEFDSRLIKTGDVFLALTSGARDGHDFIPVAVDNGAIASIVSKAVDTPHILVADTEKAFQDLAHYYIKKMGVDVIAVTGSNGKTTTKDMIAQVLASTYKTYKTQGNYNNEIGLPYTVLHMPNETQKLVLEMGQDRMGDIHTLSLIAEPKISVITMIGEAHLEFFGTRDKIAEGKMQIVDGMTPDSTLIAPADKVINPYLPEDQTVVRFGPDEDIFVTELDEHKDYLTFKVNFLEGEITVPMTGKYNATNAMLAAYVGQLEGVDAEDIRKALAHVAITKNRTEWLKAANGADILSDVYNANPTAMKLILESFQAIPRNEGGRKIAVLADMLELGPKSSDLHTEVIMSMSPETLDAIYFYGKEIEQLAILAGEMWPKGKVLYYRKDDEKDELNALIFDVVANLKPEDQILLKGSNSMKLSTLVEELQNRIAIK
jgi:UDP-N-acetylmuramoyl-tripeptide--D-alanyl-D-alanine ligase